MAITISGENNNDRILASDGVIDQISGINFSGIITASHINVGNNIQLGNAGIVTATTFIGNLTGNVNSSSNLLLQIGGSEKFRVGSSGQFGIAGANYGSSGQVFTSGGSGSAPSWVTPAVTGFANGVNNRIVTATSATGLNAEQNLTWNGTTLDVTGNYSVKDPSTASYITHTFSSNFAKIDIRGTNIANSNHYLIGYGAGHSEANDLHIVNTVGDIILRTTQEKVRLESGGDIKLSNADSIIHTSADTSRLRLFGGSTNSVSNGAALSLNGVNHSAGNYADLAAGSGGHIQFRIGTNEKIRILSSGELRIISTGNNNDPAHLRLHSNDVSIGANDAIGVIRFAGRDSGGSTVSRTGALIQGTAAATWDTGQTSGYSATHIDFFTQENSGIDTIAAGKRLRITSEGALQIGNLETGGNTTHSSQTKLYIDSTRHYKIARRASPYINNNGVGWYNAARIGAFGAAYKCFISVGGDFKADIVNVEILATSYNASLNNTLAGPIMRVTKTNVHNYNRISKVRIARDSSNVVYIQFYLDGGYNQYSWGKSTLETEMGTYSQGNADSANYPMFEKISGTYTNIKEVDINVRDTIVHTGTVSKPDNFYLVARRSGNQTGYNASNIADNIIWNLFAEGSPGASAYLNTSNGLFTAPYTGLYHFHVAVNCSYNVQGAWLNINGSRPNYSAFYPNGNQSDDGTIIYKLTKGDTVGTKWYYNGITNGTINANALHTWWRIVLL